MPPQHTLSFECGVAPRQKPVKAHRVSYHSSKSVKRKTDALIDFVSMSVESYPNDFYWYKARTVVK